MLLTLPVALRLRRFQLQTCEMSSPCISQTPGTLSFIETGRMSVDLGQESLV
jgi:hypothetical protein